jgi:hypothetical protein
MTKRQQVVTVANFFGSDHATIPIRPEPYVIKSVYMSVQALGTASARYPRITVQMTGNGPVIGQWSTASGINDAEVKNVTFSAAVANNGSAATMGVEIPGGMLIEVGWDVFIDLEGGDSLDVVSLVAMTIDPVDKYP